MDEALRLAAAELTRIGSTCEYCGSENVETHLDHIIPKRRGGASTPANSAMACVPCNLRKSDQLGWVTLDGRSGELETGLDGPDAGPRTRRSDGRNDLSSFL